MASLDILNNTQSNLHNVANRMEKRPTLSAMDIQAREQKEMFLKLLMTQLKHQTPDNPMNPNEMLNSFYQMANYEKLSEMNSSIGKITGMLQHNSNTQTSANIVGKSIIIESAKARITGDNKVKVGYMLDGKESANQLKIYLYNKDGKIIAERSIKDMETNKVHIMDITLSEEEAAKMLEDKEKILAIAIKKKESNTGADGAKTYSIDTIEQILANGDMVTTSNGLKNIDDIMGFDNSEDACIQKAQQSELSRVQKLYNSLNDSISQKLSDQLK